ncbi:ubiquitin carboxyl-terminal hydrolase 24-like, partial [Lingula anatina]|uniref:Ubiquitin carboxyl-terminal hydrolase 24-like n=1 Tax=Lingula anatina TaxID=7574 RepID=A0A2R2MM85_LINAN
MEVNEEHVSTLLSMGFPSESEVRRALRLGKNDLNEAVAFLTNEAPGSSFDTLEELDVEMKDDQANKQATTSPVYGPAPPPSYDEVVDHEQKEVSKPEDGAEENSEESNEFPVTNLYELEGRVFTDNWSIPYKREESLGKCLIAATRFAAN